MGLLILKYLNLAAGIWIFAYAVLRLGHVQHALKSPVLWIHAGIVGGAIGMIYAAISGHASVSETIFNVSIASYFVAMASQKRRGNL